MVELLDPPAQPTNGSAEPIANACPPGYLIKGNVRANGEKIYHAPGGLAYKRTNPKVCFHTEEDALAAGFRKSRM
ncbi:MAG: sunset domain-containing protein [Chloroflexota bacterium]